MLKTNRFFSQFFNKKILPTVKTHLRVFLTLMWFLMSQSTSTPPLGPTKVLTTYGKAARNPVYKEIAIPLAFQFFSLLFFVRIREGARVARDMYVF